MQTYSADRFASGKWRNYWYLVCL